MNLREMFSGNARIRPESLRFCGSFDPFQALQTHSSCEAPQKVAACHPQIGEREQRRQLRGVLLQSTVPHLDEAELTLDHPEWVFHLRPQARLQSLDLIERAAPCRIRQGPAFARSHRHLPCHARSFWPLAGALVTGISEHDRLFAMQQSVTLGDVIDVGGGADHGMDQPRFGIRSNVGLHPKVPLIALLGLVHLRVPLAGAVLGRTGGGNQGGIDNRAGLEQQTCLSKHGIDGIKHRLGQLVRFQQVPETKDGGFVRQPAHARIEFGKLPIQWNVVQGFFHSGIGQREPLLHEMHPQHGLQIKRQRATVLSRGVVRLNQRNEHRPRHNPLHLVEEDPLARTLGCQIKSGTRQTLLFHAMIIPKDSARQTQNTAGLCRVSLGT